MPKFIEFQDIPDGAYFIQAHAWAYGSTRVYQKTLEDGGPHNAVLKDDSSKGILIYRKALVIEIKPEV